MEGIDNRGGFLIRYRTGISTNDILPGKSYPCLMTATAVSVGRSSVIGYRKWIGCMVQYGFGIRSTLFYYYGM